LKVWADKYKAQAKKAKDNYATEQLYEFAKTMPVKISRGENHPRHLDAKLGISKNR
jgi:hypothetical protein